METVSFMRSLAQGLQNLYYVSYGKLCLHQSHELIEICRLRKFFWTCKLQKYLYTDKLLNPWEKEIC